MNNCKGNGREAFIKGVLPDGSVCVHGDGHNAVIYSPNAYAARVARLNKLPPPEECEEAVRASYKGYIRDVLNEERRNLCGQQPKPL